VFLSCLFGSEVDATHAFFLIVKEKQLFFRN